MPWDCFHKLSGRALINCIPRLGQQFIKSPCVFYIQLCRITNCYHLLCDVYGFIVSMQTVRLSHQNLVGYSSGKQLRGVREDSCGKGVHMKTKSSTGKKLICLWKNSLLNLTDSSLSNAWAERTVIVAMGRK